mmetsp:Transcript_21696/g.61497  ORF Transcript_21696/g.61497 Transcript_21696/m.61497 type:complete len:208 (-) Transcript_21696:553-1176(-)
MPRAVQADDLETPPPTARLQQRPQPLLFRTRGQEAVVLREHEQGRWKRALLGRDCPQLAADGLATIAEPRAEAKADSVWGQQLGNLLRVGKEALQHRVDALQVAALPQHHRDNAREHPAQLRGVRHGGGQGEGANVGVGRPLGAVAHLLQQLRVAEALGRRQLLAPRQGREGAAQQGPGRAPIGCCGVHQQEATQLCAQLERDLDRQ